MKRSSIIKWEKEKEYTHIISPHGFRCSFLGFFSYKLFLTPVISEFLDITNYTYNAFISAPERTWNNTKTHIYTTTLKSIELHVFEMRKCRNRIESDDYEYRESVDTKCDLVLQSSDKLVENARTEINSTRGPYSCVKLWSWRLVPWRKSRMRMS